MTRNGIASVGRGGARSVRLSKIGKWTLIAALAGGTGQAALVAQAPPPDPQLIVGRNSNMLGGEQILRLNPFEVRGDVLGRADNEPSCAISTRNPDHIICGANTYRMVDVPGVSATSETRDAWQGVYQSVTGGETWESTLHPGFFLDPQPHAFKLLDFRAAADATVRSGVAGLAFHSGIAFKKDKSVNSLFVSTFADLNNRENDTMPFKFVRTTIVDLRVAPKFIDKPWIYVEAAPAGQTCRMIVRTDSEGTPFWATTWWGKLVSRWLSKRWPGWTPKHFVTQEVPASIVHVVYSIFLDTAETKADLMYSKSTNCGATFSTPKKLSAVSEPANGAAIAKIPVNGSQKVFAAWRRVKVATTLAPHAVLSTVSNNGGGTWSLPTVVAEICPFEQGTTANSFRTTAFPTMTADATGRAYLAWSDRGRQPNGTCDPFGAGRIMISTSTDGVTWSAPYAAMPSPTGEHQIMPSLAFTAGKLFLAWVDFAEDVSGVFDQFVDEANLFQIGTPPLPKNPPAKRHTADVRAAMADPLAAPDFSADVARVSKYLMGRTPSIAPDIPGQPVQLQWNAVNRRWARKMTVPFDGDYIDIATRPFLPPDSTANPPRLNWTPNNGVVPTTPTILMAWTDNRDMRDVAPSQLNADGSVPFSVPANVPGVLELGNGASIADPTQNRQMCVPGQVYKTGTTNQNVYAARALAGFAATSPSGNKALGAVTRSFVVYVRNDTGVSKTFRLQIANQPPGGVASFDQFNPTQVVVEPIIVARYSGIARTVFVSRKAGATPLDPKATVRVDVTELAGGAPVSTDSILLNGDRSAPEIDSPEIDSREIYLPEIDSPEIDSHGVNAPEIDSPEIDSPEIDSETLKSLGLQAPEIDSPEIDSPEIDSPEIDSPEIDSPEIDSAPIFDFRVELTNVGNTTAQYNAKSLIRGNANAGDFNYQIIVRRKYPLRAVTTECLPTTIPVSKVVVNVLNVNPQSPEIDSPEIDSSAPGTASFAVPPGVTFDVIVRTRKLRAAAADPTVDDIAVAAQQEAVDTDDAAAGITTAPVFTSFLSVATTVLPAGRTGTPYSRQLEASGGLIPLSWSRTAGLLPPGLALSASGLITGTPTTPGTYPFDVEVRDSSAPQEIAARKLSITITQTGVASLAFVTQPTPVVFGQPIEPAVSVRALNANGSFAVGIPITIAIGSNTGGGTLSGTVSAVTGATGIAVFPTLRIDTIGVGYTLVASGAGFPSATSLPFSVTTAAGEVASNEFIPVGSLGAARLDHAAALLRDGKVLIVGGFGPGFTANASAEIYDPLTRLFTPTTGPMNVARHTPTATLLIAGAGNTLDGRVLIVGGGSATAEIYDPATGLFTLTVGSMMAPRQNHTATLVLDTMTTGAVKVLITGGDSDGPLDTAELFDPSTGLFTPAGTMTVARADHRATPLTDQRVLITGGHNSASNTQAIAEIWDPLTHSFATTGSLINSRELHTATLLLDGRVLVAGGRQGSNAGYSFLSGAELYDPDTGLFTATGPLQTARTTHTATIRPQDGRVLIAGGFNFGDLTSAELYDPSSGTFSTTGSLAIGRHFHSSTWLYDGSVLVAGGFVDGVPSASAELFAPLNTSGVVPGFAPTGSMTAARAFPGTALLENGRVLVVGGYDLDGLGGNGLVSAEVHDPATGTFAATGSMTTRRGYFWNGANPVRLANGKVLVAGGLSIGPDFTTTHATAELYDPAAGTFSLTGSMARGRDGHTMTRLADGRVLVTGGYTLGEPSILNTAEVYNPATGLFTPTTGSMNAARYGHQATLLPDGKVLITGGFASSSSLASAELYDPATGAFSLTGSMGNARGGHGAVRLLNGTVLVAGGLDFVTNVENSYTATAEIYNPASGTFTFTGRLHALAPNPNLTLLDNGKVLLTSSGGSLFESGELSFFIIANAVGELYDPAAAAFAVLPAMTTARWGPGATRLPDGRVLITGGQTNGESSGSVLATAEVFRPQ